MDRLRIFKFVIFAIGAVIILRFFYWQVISQISAQNETFISENEIPALRGEIYTNDNFPIVANEEAFLIYAKPQEIEDPQKTAHFLAPFLISEKYATMEANLTDTEKEEKESEIKNKEIEIKEKLQNTALKWVQIARKVPSDAVNTIKAQNIGGIGFERDERRLYAEASMAAQLLGFVGSDKFGRDIGYFGLEGFYDRRLSGKPGRLGQENDPLGIPILVGKYRPIAPEKGSSLYLNIDRTIQFIVENELRDAVEKYGAKEGNVIIAEPSTGKIMAMSTYPTYDPALRLEYDESLYKNPVVADTYEPGSTFKLVTMAAGIDLSLVKPETKCDICTGPRSIGGFEISTWNNKYFPNSTMTEVIQHSDNIGMTFVADKLGVDRFYDYIEKFGFGKPTGIDLQEESPATLREKSQWRPIDLATASFGQGIAVTPIQMVQAISAIANGGTLITPQVVDKIVDSNGNTEEIKPKVERRVISAKTASQLTEMMVNAVEKGEAQAFAPKGYRIAGKTGTAQIPVAGHYDPEKTIASFIGFAPADNPRFVMLVRFTEPQSSPYGSETAAPTFFAITKEIFNYLKIPTNK